MICTSAPPKPCDESIDGLDVGEQVDHPIKIRRSWLGGPVHVPRRKILAKYIHLTIYILQVCGEDDRQMLVCGSLQAVIAQSHKPVRGEGAELRRGLEGWCTLIGTVHHP